MFAAIFAIGLVHCFASDSYFKLQLYSIAFCLVFFWHCQMRHLLPSLELLAFWEVNALLVVASIWLLTQWVPIFLGIFIVLVVLVPICFFLYAAKLWWLVSLELLEHFSRSIDRFIISCHLRLLLDADSCKFATKLTSAIHQIIKSVRVFLVVWISMGHSVLDGEQDQIEAEGWMVLANRASFKLNMATPFIVTIGSSQPFNDHVDHF